MFAERAFPAQNPTDRAVAEEGTAMAFTHRLLPIAAALFSLPAHASFHTYVIDELYSSADGTVQYIVLHESLGMNGENLLGGHTLTATHGGQTKSFTFPQDLPGGMCDYYSCMGSPTAGTRVLIATDGFTALGLVTPDYVVPNGFLPIDGGTINYAGVDAVTFPALPTDGLNAFYRDGTTRRNLAINFARDSASVALSAVNYQGLWWATGGAEPFWGINLAHAGDQIFATWYTYDTTGRAWWLSMLADNRSAPSSNTYSGPINADRGPPFNNFVGAGVPDPVGNGTLSFTDANTGTFHYDLNAGTGGSPVPVSQTKAIERYNLGTGAQPMCTFSATANLALATNYQDLWWVANGAESGWGINFAHQGDSVFATWYTYDIDRTPLWLSALTHRQGTTNIYSGPLTRTSGPRFDAYKASDVVLPIPTVGTATLTFANGNNATFNYITNGSGGLPAGVNQTKSIVRFPITSGGTICQ